MTKISRQSNSIYSLALTCDLKALVPFPLSTSQAVAWGIWNGKGDRVCYFCLFPPHLFWFISLSVEQWEEGQETEQMFLSLFERATAILCWLWLLLQVISPNWSCPRFLYQEPKHLFFPKDKGVSILEGPMGSFISLKEETQLQLCLFFLQPNDPAPFPNFSLSLSPPPPSKSLTPGSQYLTDTSLEEYTCKTTKAQLPTIMSRVS